MSSSNAFMIKDLLYTVVKALEALSTRVPRSNTIQEKFKELAVQLRNWWKKLSFDVAKLDFLLEPTGNKDLYRNVFKAISEISYQLLRIILTAVEHGIGLSSTVVVDAGRAMADIKNMAPGLGISTSGYASKGDKKENAPYAVLFNGTSRGDKKFKVVETVVVEHVAACYQDLKELTGSIERAYKRHLGLRLLAGKSVVT